MTIPHGLPKGCTSRGCFHPEILRMIILLPIHCRIMASHDLWVKTISFLQSVTDISPNCLCPAGYYMLCRLHYNTLHESDE